MGLDGQDIGVGRVNQGHSRVASQADCNQGLNHHQSAEQEFQGYEEPNEACC